MFSKIVFKHRQLKYFSHYFTKIIIHLLDKFMFYSNIFNSYQVSIIYDWKRPLYEEYVIKNRNYIFIKGIHEFFIDQYETCPLSQNGYFLLLSICLHVLLLIIIILLISITINRLCFIYSVTTDQPFTFMNNAQVGCYHFIIELICLFCSS